MTAMRPTSDDPQSPFGTNEDGSPVAPYGLKTDGTPRRSPGGRQAGKTGSAPRAPRRRAAAPAGAPKGAEGPSPEDQKAALISLSDSFLTTGMVMLSGVPMVQAIIGPKHAFALCGDAVIVNAYVPPIADGLVALAETRPGILSWLDRAAENAPYLLLVKALAECAGAIAANHKNPRQDLAAAGQALFAMNMSKMAKAVADEAAAQGFEPVPEDATPESEAA